MSFTVIKAGAAAPSDYFENQTTPVYPMQTWSWAADFWQVEKGGLAGHQAFLVQVSDPTQKFWIQALVYQYPWHLNQVFLTIPRGPNCSFELHRAAGKLQTELLQEFQNSLDELAKSSKACFLKIEPTWDGSQILDLTTGDIDGGIAPLQYRLGTDLLQQFQRHTINQNTKFLQPPYSRTIKIQVPNILTQTLQGAASETSFGVWFEAYFEPVIACFEAKTRYNARLSRKKNLEISWDKSAAAFEEFWEIMQKTANRQEFVPYTKAYYQNVLKNDWADLVLIKTAAGQVTNAWMGSFTAGMGMYLYGGSDLAYSNLKGAELIHTAAMIRTLQKCGKVAGTETGEQFELIYDMGGSSLLDGALPAWDGYSKFKKGFGGKIVEYLPHTFDVIYKTWKYTWVQFLIDRLKPALQKLRGRA